MSTVTSVPVPELVLDNRVFSFAAFIVPARLPDGGYLEYQPHLRYHRFGVESLNPHGLGPFCKFRVGGLPHTSGIYAFVVGGLVRYIGRTVDLAARMGPVNYGAISPKNCYRSGQSTNCKINSHVLRAVKNGQTVALYILPTNDLAIEAGIINAVHPAWNGRMV